MKLSRLFRKTLIWIGLLFAVLTVAAGAFSGWALYRNLSDEYRSKGAAIATSIANSSVNLLLNNDLATVQSTVDQFLSIDGVSYVFLVNADREFICHTFVPKVPDELRVLAGSGSQSVRDGPEAVSITRMEGVIDVAAPVLGGLLGSVHVGMDRQDVLDKIHAGILRLSLVFFFLFCASLVVTYRLVQRVSRPLLDLTDYAGHLAKRDWSQKVVVQSEDEIGLLAETMQSMARDLSNVFGKLEEKVREATQELRAKNRKLERALQRVQEMQQRVIVQEKLASLGTLTAGIAHEIRNPLNFVKNFAELSGDAIRELKEEWMGVRNRIEVEKSKDLDVLFDDLEKNLTSIVEHAKRADGVVQSMLLHSRGQPGECRATDVNALVKQYVNLAFHGMRARNRDFQLDIRMDFDETVDSAKAVTQDLARAFLNILNNACEAVAEKQKQKGPEYSPSLWIRTKRVGCWAATSIMDTRQLVDGVEIRIRDNGNGIPEDAKEKLFAPFFTTKPPGEGTGLGLSIARDIIAGQHRGTIELETQEGAYTEFVITLPLDLDAGKEVQ